MPVAQTLVELLRGDRAASQEIALFEAPGSYRRLTAEELERAALLRLGALQAAGLGEGSELVMPLEDNGEFLEVFWASQLGGFVPMPLSPPANGASCAKILDILCARTDAALVASDAGLQRLKEAQQDGSVDAASRERWSALDLDQRRVKAASGASPASAVPRSPGDIAFIQYSSGSTRSPKGVIVRHGQAIANLKAITTGLQATASDRSFSWMPLSHDMGLVGFHLAPLYAGANQALMPTATFARTPLLWLEEAMGQGSTILSSPNFGYRHTLRAIDRKGMPEGLDLSAVRLILNGAEPISVELAKEFVERLGPSGLPDTAMLPVYGLAEATLAVSFPGLGLPISSLSLQRDRLALGDEIATDPGAGALVSCGCGSPLPGVEVQVCDKGGSPLDENHVGRIWIRGGGVTEGYYHDPEATAEALMGEGWLDTGDLGFLREGQLFVAGRRKDLVIVDGQNFYPHDLEQSLQLALGIDPMRVAVAPVHPPGGAGETVGVFVHHRGEAATFQETRKQVRAHLSTTFGIRADLVVPVAQIPRTTSGKVQRLQLAKALVAGDYDAALQALDPEFSLAKGGAPNTADAPEPERPEPSAPADVSPEAMEAMMAGFAERVLEGLRFGPTDNLFEQGMSSIDLAEIHGLIEARYPKGLDIRDFFDHPTLRELSVVLSERVQAGTVKAT